MIPKQWMNEVLIDWLFLSTMMLTFVLIYMLHLWHPAIMGL